MAEHAVLRALGELHGLVARVFVMSDGWLNVQIQNPITRLASGFMMRDVNLLTPGDITYIRATLFPILFKARARL